MVIFHGELLNNQMANNEWLIYCTMMCDVVMPVPLYPKPTVSTIYIELYIYDTTVLTQS